MFCVPKAMPGRSNPVVKVEEVLATRDVVRIAQLRKTPDFLN